MSTVYCEIGLPYAPVPTYILSQPTGAHVVQIQNKGRERLISKDLDKIDGFETASFHEETRFVVKPDETSIVLSHLVRHSADILPSDLAPTGLVVQRENEVRIYLLQHPELQELIPQAVAAVRKHIPDAHLLLDVYSDPEIEDSYLVLYVRLPVYDETLLARIEQAEAEYIERLSNSTGWLQLTTDFQPSGSIDAV